MLPLAITVLFSLAAVPELEIDVHRGPGPKVLLGDRYTVTYQVSLLGGKELANSDLRGLPFSKELGDGHDGYLDRWVLGMNVGGKREILFNSDFAPQSLKESLPAGRDLVVTLRLVAVKKMSAR